MPLKRYDKDEILDACLSVFAAHGYDNTSTAMLAAAAGVSKALIFHHFNSKKALFLCLLDRCVAQAKIQVNVDALREYQDFFAAREQLSLMKYKFNKENPDIYKVLMEAYITTPDELKAEIIERTEVLFSERNAIWEQMFAKVPLKEGINRAEAFELVVLALDYFDQKFLTETEVESEKRLDDHYMQHFLDKRRRFLAMIRQGIEG